MFILFLNFSSCKHGTMSKMGRKGYWRTVFTTACLTSSYYGQRQNQQIIGLNILEGVLWNLCQVFFGTGMKTDLFQSYGHCWVFHNCWHIECSTFTVSSFRIWNSSAGIPSPPLALFVVMLPKAHLTSHSRMSGSRWVVTPSWLSGLWRSFLYSSSVYSCHLFLISSISVRSLQFLPFIEPIFAWNVPLVSLIFLKRSLVFPILLFSSSSLPWSLRKAFLSLFVILCNSVFKWVYLSFSPLLSQLFVRPPQIAILLFCISFSWAMPKNAQTAAQLHSSHMLVK